jgi:hypothetical protein
MPEFLTLLPPSESLDKLLRNLPGPQPATETIDTAAALGRITATDLRAPHDLPEFPRSTVDGFAVKSADTFGASDSLPAYLNLIGECPMGAVPDLEIHPTETAIIHTGGMLPKGADAVVMMEYTQTLRRGRQPSGGQPSAPTEFLSAPAGSSQMLGPQSSQATGWAWKRLLSGSLYSSAQVSHIGKSAIVVLGRS